MKVSVALSVHGHFYQPPREDPLTGEIPLEPGAFPYKNWNERIHAQCYKPNAELGCFEQISFNIGPTLARWMAVSQPQTLAKIVEQERRNYERFGVGNALAQPYHHTILPLSSRQDKLTQVLWGIGDYEHRFGHKPTGMWLPETAVDQETLDVLVECGIEFTILAPWQASSTNLDVNHPYWVSLSGGKKIAVFFYEQDLSARVSFDPAATVNADSFVLELLLPKYRPATWQSKQRQLVLIASDGELYGHHQPFRDKFLAYLMDGALQKHPVEATYPALWLKQSPPKETISIFPQTSWSCHHGITRWAGSCTCTPNSEWKAPLRDALNKLAEKADNLYLETLRPYLDDPWQLRHRYIQVLNGEMDEAELIASLVGRPLEKREVDKIQILLAAQYERQRMFTSCGWFFDDFNRIEPVNNVAYAAQCVWLTYLATGVDLAPQATNWLKRVKSWRSGLSGDTVFERHLQRSREAQKVHGQSSG